MLKIKKYFVYFAALNLVWPIVTFADLHVSLYSMNNQENNQPVGYVLIQKHKYGILFIPNLKNLTPGIHGFHVHQNSSCANQGMAAGDHLDPMKTKKHRGPYNDDGHLGDLPALYIEKNGQSTLPVLAPRFKNLKQLQGHSLVIHAGGDNYQDMPMQLGGGGSRMICGIIK